MNIIVGKNGVGKTQFLKSLMNVLQNLKIYNLYISENFDIEGSSMIIPAIIVEKIKEGITKFNAEYLQLNFLKEYNNTESDNQGLSINRRKGYFRISKSYSNSITHLIFELLVELSEIQFNNMDHSEFLKSLNQLKMDFQTFHEDVQLIKEKFDSEKNREYFLNIEFEHDTMHFPGESRFNIIHTLLGDKLHPSETGYYMPLNVTGFHKLLSKNLTDFFDLSGGGRKLRDATRSTTHNINKYNTGRIVYLNNDIIPQNLSDEYLRQDNSRKQQNLNDNLLNRPSNIPNLIRNMYFSEDVDKNFQEIFSEYQLEYSKIILQLNDQLRLNKIDEQTYLNQRREVIPLGSQINSLLFASGLKLYLDEENFTEYPHRQIFRRRISEKNSNSDPHVQYENLSSGEKKMLLKCLHLSTWYNGPIWLFVDEPDAHLHWELQDKYYEILKEKISQSAHSQAWIATHSQAIVDKALNDDEASVYLMEENKDGVISVHHVDKDNLISNKILPHLSGRMMKFIDAPLLFVEGVYDRNRLLSLLSINKMKKNKWRINFAGGSQIFHIMSEIINTGIFENDILDDVYFIIDGDKKHEFSAKIIRWKDELTDQLQRDRLKILEQHVHVLGAYDFESLILGTKYSDTDSKYNYVIEKVYLTLVKNKVKPQSKANLELLDEFNKKLGDAFNDDTVKKLSEFETSQDLQKKIFLTCGKDLTFSLFTKTLGLKGLEDLNGLIHEIVLELDRDELSLNNDPLSDLLRFLAIQS